MNLFPTISSPPAVTESLSTANTSMTSMAVIYVTVTAVSSSLSVIGSVVVIGAHVAFRDLRTTGRAMLVQLSVADMLTALGNLLGVVWVLFRDSEVLNGSMVYCYIQSAWTIFSSIASFLWTMAIAMVIAWAIIRKTRNTASRFWTVFMVVCWGLPGVVTLSAVSCRVLGYDHNLHQASWCWIDLHARHHLFWTFFTGKAWELGASVLTLILYSAISVTLFRHKTRTKAVVSKRRGRGDLIHEANLKLTFVPLVFIVLRSWGTIRFFLAHIDYCYASSPAASWVVPLQGLGDSSQGFANFVMHCFCTRSIRQRLLRQCRGTKVADNTTLYEEGRHHLPTVAVLSANIGASLANHATEHGAQAVGPVTSVARKKPGT